RDGAVLHRPRRPRARRGVRPAHRGFSSGRRARERVTGKDVIDLPDLTAVKSALRAQRIETPSWAFANSGTRFKVFTQAGVPRTPEEKIADAAQVHRVTGLAPTVALHIPWDRVDDY